MKIFAALLINIALSFPAYSQDLIKSVNDFRQSQSRPIVIVDQCLQKQAEAHCVWMTTNGMSHQGFYNRLNTCKMYGGECVAYGNNPVQLWINSGPHRRIMLGNYRYIGVASK